MAEFGKRKYAAGAPSHRQPAPSADLAGALAAARTGKLPYWAKIGPVRLVVSLLALAAVLWFLILPYAGDILRDHRLAGTWRPAYDMQVADGLCTRHNFLITNCSAKIKSRAEPNQAPVAVDFMMAFVSGGGQPLTPVCSSVDPNALTIAYAAETELLNRTLTFLAMAVGLVAGFLAGLSALVKGRYVGGAAHRALLAGFAELKTRVESAQADPRAAA